uniref:SLC12 domain-containing protein n=1 Tax=Gongylonema pulchrum TaxID=637853 RepID=A0A183E9K2_9BILA
LTGKQKKLAIEMNKFHRRIKKGRIDVWWLYDDGGLTLLVPHLLRLPKSYLEGAELRVFTIASSQACAQADEKKMAALLSKFRIPFTDVRVIADIAREPHPSTFVDFLLSYIALVAEEQRNILAIRDFEAIIAPLRDNEKEKRSGLIADVDLAAQKKRTIRQLRARELLQLHSHQSDLIVITLPVPRLEICSCLYMSWLDLMTRDLPPVLMIRGNQTSVLTFYT